MTELRREAKVVRILCLATLIGFGHLVGAARAITVFQEHGGAKKRPSATEKIADRLAAKTKYKLQYRLETGQKLYWKVEHVTTTKTQIAGKTEEASARVETVSSWTVTDHNPANGQAVFSNAIQSIKAWKQVGDEKPSLYDSSTGQTPPDEYLIASKQIGKPRSRITISPEGRVLDRQSEYKSTDFSTGEITIPLPEKKIPIGYQWYEPTEFESANEYGAHVTLKARRCYELRKIKDGNAYVTFRTEVLTPIDSDKVRSKILQKLISGTVVWSLKKGLPIQKIVVWDEKVQGYEGEDSYLKYSGKMTIKLVSDQEYANVAKREKLERLTPLQVTMVKLRRPQDRPILRR